MSDISSNNKRIEYIDALRGFTMILVVYYHITQKSFNSDGTFIDLLLVSFRMPLFFFISGFIGYRDNVVWDIRTWWVISKKKLLIQLLPTFVFGLIFAYTYRHIDFKVFLSENFKAGYWFTIVLLEMLLLMYTTNVVLFDKDSKIFKKRIFIALLVLSIISFFAIFLPLIISSLDNCFKVFSLYQTFTYFPYFAFGYICSMYKNSFSKILEHKYFATAIIVTFALLFSIDFFYLMPYANKGVESITLLHIILGKTNGFLGLLIVYNTFRVYQDTFTSDKKIGRSLQYIGKRTLDIYMLQYFFLPYLPQVGEILRKGNNAILELTLGLSVSLIVIGICLVVSNVLRTSPILAKYLFGVKSK